jgi:processing peptidase subunit alpha
MNLRISNKIKLNKSSFGRIIPRFYQTYPDPNENPKISTSVSSVEKQLNKSDGKFNLADKFKLDQLFPGVPISKGIVKGVQPTTKSTTLSNGLTIASQEMPGLMSSFAFIVNSGSAFEIQDGTNLNTGVTHVLELTAFRSTTNRSHQEFLTEMEQLGGMVQCISSRENIMYCVDVLRDNLEPALNLFADAIINPTISIEEIEESKEVISLQYDQMPAELLSKDAVQMSAFNGYPLGNSHFCPPDAIKDINQDKIMKFRDQYLFGENCYIAGAGVDHEMFSNLIEKSFFNKMKNGGETKKLEKNISKYTGGMITSERPLQEPFVKVSVAFEIGGWTDKKLVVACVLQQLLGGGSSFSAGGPGKGMYTRLYREVLNQNYWVESAESFISVHDDAGIFGIDGSCPAEYVSHLLRVIIEQLVKLETVKVSNEELSRAKNMLKSMMMMQLESRLVLCEDIARQFVTFGKRDTPGDVSEKIDAVTVENIQELATNMLKSPPSIGCVGEDLSKLPTYKQIADFTTHLTQSSRQNSN